MDFQGNSQPESGKLEQIVSQFLLKSLHVICDSRIPALRPNDRSGEFLPVPRVRKSDKWFNLVLGDRPAALENLNFWHRNVMDPMIIDIILVHEGPKSSSVDNLYTAPTASTSIETVIERWVVQYESPRVAPHPQSQTGELSASYKRTYKKSIVLLRALYLQMRLLPAYRLFRQLNSSTQNYNFDIIYKVSSFGDPFSRAEENLFEEYSFPPVEAFPGRLSVSVNYRSALSDFNLEPSTAIPPKIISDYVGSPATDPMRSFPVSEKGVRATSFPLRGARPPSASPLDRPHSWTSGFHKAAPFSGSPPTYRPSPPTPSDFSSSPVDMYGARAQSYNRMLNHQRSVGYDEYQLSPPFSPSPSPSPSPPTYFHGGNQNPMAQIRKSSDTAPVTIPATMTGRSSRYLSPCFSDPSRNPLPPLSPRSTRNDHSSHESPSGIRSCRKIGEISSGMTNHHVGQKIVRDGRDDSGRFSGPLSSSGSPRVGFSGSSSRFSFQDDLDDIGFSCAFVVDDVDPPDFQTSNIQSAPGRRALESTAPIGRKSQDAAVGVLVHMLRTAPPLRQDASCYSAADVAPRADPDAGPATASGFFMPRKAADALEELRSYREMKDLLLSKSGIRVVSARDES